MLIKIYKRKLNKIFFYFILFFIFFFYFFLIFFPFSVKQQKIFEQQACKTEHHTVYIKSNCTIE